MIAMYIYIPVDLYPLFLDSCYQLAKLLTLLDSLTCVLFPDRKREYTSTHVISIEYILYLYHHHVSIFPCLYRIPMYFLHVRKNHFGIFPCSLLPRKKKQKHLHEVPTTSSTAPRPSATLWNSVTLAAAHPGLVWWKDENMEDHPI